MAITVRVENFGPPFRGWVRANIDVMPPHPTGTVQGVNYVLGRQTGRDTRAIDFWVNLAAGQSLVLDLEQAQPWAFQRAPLPADPLGWTGGPLWMNGSNASWIGLQADGAGYLMHLRSRNGMQSSEAWLRYYPDQPWIEAEIVRTMSDPSRPNMGGYVSPGVGFGDAVVLGGLADLGMAEAADGQAVATPVLFAWPAHFGPTDWASVGALAQHAVRAVAIQRLYPQGNPHVPVGYTEQTAHDWAKGKIAEAIRVLGTWDAPVCGPNKRSSDTGGQEDQVFVGIEALLSPPAATVRYLSALKMANRPCHHLEVDGSPLTGASYDGGLPIMWNGRPHQGLWSQVDKRGKPSPIGESSPLPHGWWGPDVEHWLINTLYIAARITGSPALQWLLTFQARLYPMQWTTRAGWSTSGSNASRAVGWEGWNAVLLYEALEDRAEAERVRAHWQQRWDLVLSTSPRIALSPVWDIRTDVPSLGTGDWWMPWQMAVGCYGLDIAGERFDRPAARAHAFNSAELCMDRSYKRDANNRWVATSQMPVATERDAEVTRKDSWAWFGNSMAVAVTLRQMPTHATACDIWQQLLADATTTQVSAWLAPEVQ